MRIDDDTRKILITIAEAAVNLFIAIILVSSLLYFLLVLMFGVETIGDLKGFADASKDIMISLLIIVGGVLILAFLTMFVGWLSKDEGGIMILPFEVAAGDDKYSGKAISHMLTAELLRIRQIHNVKYKGISQISESFTFPLLAPTSEDLTYSISQMGPVGFGTTSIHLGPLMAILKRLWPWGDHGQVVSGSLQKYGSKTSLVACLEHQKIRAWEASEIKDGGKVGDEIIPALVSDLAFKMVHDLSLEGNAVKKITAKTWQGFKHFTEALDAYHQYNLTDDTSYLEQARIECLKAAKSEIGYEKLLKLLYNLGMAYSEKRELYKAEELLFLAYEIKPDDEFALFGLGYLYGIQNRHQKSLEYFEKAANINPKNAIIWSARAIDHIGMNQYSNALECIDIAININPKLDEDLEFHYLKGLALDKLKRYEEALDSFEEAVKLDPQKVDAHYKKGIAFGKLKRYEEALESFEKVVKLDSQRADAWYSKGATLNNLMRYEEALESFEKVVELDSQKADAWTGKGTALNNLEHYEEALKSFEKAIELDSRKANAWYGKGAALNNLMRYEDALESFEKAIELDSQNADAWTGKGIALNNLDNYEDALGPLEKAVELDSQNADAWYGKGAALNNFTRYEDALESFEKAVELGLKSATLYIALARLYRKLGRVGESAEACKSARGLIDNEDEYNCACFEAVCGSPDAAFALLRIALEKKEVTADYARRDPDFEFIRDDPRFSALLDEFSTDGKKGPE